jgi:hypothetical protein
VAFICNVLRLGEVGDLEAQMFKLAQMLIEVQKFNLALLPPFCQTPVRRMCFFARWINTKSVSRPKIENTFILIDNF